MPTQYRVAPYRGKPTLFIDGVPTPHYLYCYPLDLDLDGAEEIHRRFAAHGCRFFTINVRGGVDNDWSTSPFWIDDGVFPDITAPAEVAANNLVRQVEMIQRHAPDARFWVRYHCGLPKRYRETNLDHLLLNSYGRRYDEPSLASDKTIVQLGRFVESVVRFTERQPWGDRVAGYLVYPLGEGATVLTCEGYLFDQSPVMIEAYRAYLRGRYGSDAALWAAWGRIDVTLDGVSVPSDQAFHERGRTRQAEVTLGTDAADRPAPRRLHFPDPAETAAERDYCLLMRDLTLKHFRALLEPVKRLAPNKLAGIDGFKQTMLGWPLVARWVGDYVTHNGSQHPVTGALGMAEMLDLPELDAVATPHDYLHRGMGFGYEPEGIGDSVTLRVKLMLVEEDARSYCRSEDGRWNYFRHPQEAHAGLWRNLGASISRGHSTYPMDITRPSFFMDDAIQEILARRRDVHEAATRWPRRDAPGIAVILDDWGTLDEDFTFAYQDLAVLRQRMYGLSRCGVPFRQFLFEDLAHDDFPFQHRVYLFPNLFRVTPERLALLRRRVMRHGNVCIWGPATGITDGRHLSGELAGEVTGIPLRLRRRESPRVVTIDRFDHPITASLPRLDYGDSLAYGPILWPIDNPAVQRLGGIQWPHAFDGAGLVVRQFGRGVEGRGDGDWASIFTAAVPLPDPLLRAIARFAGLHVYHDTDDVLFADDHTITVHGIRPGPRDIRLPRPSTVWDLIERRCLGRDMTSIRIDAPPPWTRMYFLGDEDPLDPRAWA